jgi:amidase
MSADETIATASATEQAAAIRAGRISSRELLDLFASRIERLDGAFNAVVTLDLDGARVEADRADADAARGDWRGPLHGLPVTIKDAIEVAGMRSTGGAVELTDHVPETDAPSVARLKDAGAIVFGKTNVPRW